MTRKEEILKAARNYVSSVTLSSPSDVIHFENGAKWADEHPNLESLWHDASDNRFYDDVINGKWIKFSDACPEDFNLDWVLVQFVEKSGFVGLPYIAEFDKSKNIWRLQGQENDNTSETYYINNDCIPSSWKIIENSPEWEKRNDKE